MTTNVPAPVFGPKGFIAPSEAAVLAGVLSDINAAFGGGLNPALDTPQGQLATSESAVVGEANNQFVFLSNMFDPAYAEGRYQDALARIYFLERNPSQPTSVEAICTGAAGTVIPVGAQARSTDNNIYICTQAGTIPVGGSITLSFACTVDGPIACPAGSLNQIYQAIPGWDTINNPADGVLGTNTESRYDFEQRRQQTVAANSIGALGSILGAVLKVPDVLDAFVTENNTDVPITIGGAGLVPHSIFVSVVGGIADDVARAIWSKKAPGANYNGNTTVIVQDDNPAYSPPYPAYEVKFETPASLPILFKVRLANNAQVPSDAATQIQNAIINAFAGGDGGPRARIGGTIFASRFYAPIAALGTWVNIIDLKIGSPNQPVSQFTASIAGNTMTVSILAVGPIAIGQTVTDLSDGVAPGTVITSEPGGGGIGAYGVSISQTVSSRAMKGSLPASDVVVVNIDQVPTININNIVVTLV